MNPAQLNTKIRFYDITTQQNIYAGAEQDTPQVLLETYAQQLPVNQNMQFAIEAGASVFNQDMIFKIRQRNSFTPRKDMYIVSGGTEYVINAIRPVDNKGIPNAPFHANYGWEIIGVRQQ